MEMTNTLTEAFLFIGFVVIFFMLVVFTLYILQAISLYQIAKNEGHNQPWLAWIPIANLFLYPMLTENDVHKTLRGKFTFVYGITLLISFVLNPSIPLIIFIPNAMIIYAFYFVAKRYSERETIHIVIAIISLGLTLPLQTFRFRNRKPIKEEKIKVLIKR